MMKLTAIFFFLLLQSGCATVQEISSSIEYTVRGEYYLYEDDYKQGQETFKELAQEDPNNAEAQYYYGRFLLADDQARKAQPYLQKAVTLSPDKSNYHFWLGLAYGEAGQESHERKSYEKALQLDPKNIQALTYLGNNCLRAKQYKKALSYYQKALTLNQDIPQALYNKAVIMRKLHRVPEEKQAWLDYLNAYPSGNFARIATDRLNSLGDQSYRNYTLGVRTITLTAINFKPSTAELSKGSIPSLDFLGSTVANIPRGSLNVIVYQLNNLELAKKRARRIRDYLYKNFPELRTKKRIQVSWFAVSEKRTVLKKKLRLNESVQFFLTDV